MNQVALEQVMSQAKILVQQGDISAAHDLLKSVYSSVAASQSVPVTASKGEGIQRSQSLTSADHVKFEKLSKNYQKSKFLEVIKSAKILLRKYPRDSSIWNILGAAAIQCGKHEESVKAFQKALEINPEYAEAQNNLGNVLMSQGKLKEAEFSFKRAYKLKPNYSAPLNNLGAVLHRQGRYYEAVSVLTKAITIDPNYSEAFMNLGNSLKDSGELEKAVESYQRAIQIRPTYALAYNNMGDALLILNEFDKAAEAFERAIELNPYYAEAHTNLGMVYQELNMFNDAIAAHHKAIKIAPEFSGARDNLTFAQLQTESWKEAIEQREIRWETDHFSSTFREFKAPRWDGNDDNVCDKRLLVWAEQGPGDMIIWASCLNYYANKFAQVIVECPQKLLKLLKISFPNVSFRTSDNYQHGVPEDFDYQIPFESLFGHACLNGLIDKKQTEYIFPDQARVIYWKEQLQRLSDKTKIGVSWKSPVMNSSRSKNYPSLLNWQHLFQNGDCDFINLQCTDYDEDIKYIQNEFGIKVHNFKDIDQFNDLADVAALTAALDVTVSVATTTACIAAAVGARTLIPTWKQSSWNNILFASRGPRVEEFYRNTWEPWEQTFEKIELRLL